MKKKGKNKIPAVDNSPPIVPNIEPQLQKKVSDELIKGFEWYFPNEHSTYRELIDRWFLPVSFISLLKRRDSHLKKLENPKVRFKNIVQNKVKQCDIILIMIIERWIEHDFELIDEMNSFKPTRQSESDNVIHAKKKQKENIFRDDGAIWTINFKDIEKTVKHTKGMDFIALLLRHQGQSLHSIKMYQMISGIVPDTDNRMSEASPERIESDEGLQIDGKDGFKLVDQKTIDAVKNKIKKLEIQYNQAMTENDSVRENEFIAELNKHKDYLSKCTYKGKLKTVSDSTERMRISIYMAIKTAKNNIKKSHEELFNHLKKFITTGTFNSYSPDSPVSWFQDR